LSFISVYAINEKITPKKENAMFEPSNAPVSPPPAAPNNNNNRIMAIASLVLGIINLCSWFFPICGAPLAIAGLVLGYFGMRSPEQKTLAIIGMVLSGIGLLLACINAVAGLFLGPVIGNVFSTINESLGGY
jgi:membrane-bound ClpP family serine protease